MFLLPLFSLVMNWVSPSVLTYRIESFKIWEHLMYVFLCVSVVTMGYYIDPLDVCFGDQLAGFAHEPMHRGWHTFSSWLFGRNFGALFEVPCVGLNRWIWDCVMHIVESYLRESWIRGSPDSRTVGLRRYKIEDFVPCPGGTLLRVEGKLGSSDM